MWVLVLKHGITIPVVHSVLMSFSLLLFTVSVSSCVIQGLIGLLVKFFLLLYLLVCLIAVMTDERTYAKLGRAWCYEVGFKCIISTGLV